MELGADGLMQTAVVPASARDVQRLAYRDLMDALVSYRKTQDPESLDGAQFLLGWEQANPFMANYAGDVRTLLEEGADEQEEERGHGPQQTEEGGEEEGGARGARGARGEGNAARKGRDGGRTCTWRSCSFNAPREWSLNPRRRIQVSLGRVKQQTADAVQELSVLASQDPDQFGVRLLLEFMCDLLGRDSIHCQYFRAVCRVVLGDDVPIRDLHRWCACWQWQCWWRATC